VGQRIDPADPQYRGLNPAAFDRISCADRFGRATVPGESVIEIKIPRNPGQVQP
jgi:hypothetical protein